MFTSIEQFKNTWTNESSGTSKMMQALTDKALSQQVGDGHRTLGRLAWHIIQTIPEMVGRTGLNVDGPGENDSVPDSAVTIMKAYDKVSSSLVDQLTGNWNDETLLIEDDMYGEKWKRGLTLRILIDHQTHHRGQMTVLMRQAGLNVPGVYGPSREEWLQHGMNPPTV